MSRAQEQVAIKFEDNQAKGQPNQLKTEYDPAWEGERWLKAGWATGLWHRKVPIPFDRRNRVGAHSFPAHELGRPSFSKTSL